MKTNLLAYGRYKTEEKKDSSKSSGASSKESKSSDSTMYVKKGIKLNLRESPDSSSEIIASFRGGTKVTVLKKGKYYTYVEVKGLRGYMGTSYLTSDPNSDE